jgi:hypothetical protein
MPTLYEKLGLIFTFYSSDMDEPPHIHIKGEKGRMKI